MNKLTSIWKVAVLIFVFSTSVVAQENPAQVIASYLKAHVQEMGLVSADVAHFTITDHVKSKHNDIQHVHIMQQINGLPLQNGVANFTMNAKNEILAVGNRLVANCEGRLSGSVSPSISPERAIKYAASHAKMKGSFGELISESDNLYTFQKGSLAQENITATLAYWESGESIELVWIVSLYQLDGQHWWQVYVNAASGEVIETADWVRSCNFAHAESKPTQQLAVANNIKSFSSSAAAGQGTYNVFAFPVESPNHGSRSIHVSPADTIASPFGWHDTDGISGAEFTTTRGNNVFAYTDVSDNNLPDYVPSGGNSLDFNFPLNLAQTPSGYQNVAVTNLFFACNRIHDIFYHYGFDEANGNFQENNYGNGGAGSDYVNAEAQDGGGTNNANFSTPPDGMNGRMQMYIWTSNSSLANLLTINSPATLAAPYNAIESSFGPGLTSTPITANLVLVDDGSGDSADACQTIVNASAINGKIAVLRRGTCAYTLKVQNAQAAGAVGVVIVNNAPGITPPGGSSSTITIPSIMISQADGNAIIASLKAGNTVNGTLVADSLAGFDRDGDLDNGIIAHEYGHGISTRITGGPSSSGCLNNSEQMGEGWSDYFATVLTMNTSIANPVNRPMGSYASGEPPVGSTGIRNAPYDTNFAVNGFTYADVANPAQISEPHGIGFIWATMLWDLTWDLIDVYGYDANIDSGNGGNNIALQLVMDGLALQPCSPGFVDGRDAILLADQLNNGGANQCLIWKAFAKRGLGYSASQGSTFSRLDGVAAFDLPNSCLTPTSSPTANFSSANTESCNGIIRFTDLSVNIPQAWFWDFGDGNTDSVQNPVHTYSASGLYTVTLVASNSLGSDTIVNTNFITINLPTSPTAFANGSGCSSDSISLTASGSGTIGWFNIANQLLATGNTFNAPPSQSTTTYYARNGTFYTPGFVGPADNFFAGGSYHNTSFIGAVNFVAHEEITIYSAWVNSDAVGPRTITLWDAYNSGGNVVQEITVDIPFTGPGRIDLGFVVPGPGQYSFGLALANLYRNNDGATYPYSIAGLIDITGSPAGPVAGVDVFYYYFYDLEVGKTACWSDSVAVTATVTDTADFSWTANNFTFSFTDLTPNATSWVWDFGDGASSTQQNPMHTYAQPGNYTVSLSVNGGTCVVIYTVNVGSFAINESDLNGFEMTLYPNPAKTEFTVGFNQELEQQAIVSLYSLQGQLIKSATINKGEKTATIHVNSLSANMYILKVEVGGAQYYKKVLITK